MIKMPSTGSFEYVPTVVIGGGQAGLVTGYHLRQCGVAFVILETEQRIGDTWRRRYDSLRLFSMPRFASLPGLPIAVPDCPTRDEMADYLQNYADHFDLPVRYGSAVSRVSRAGDRYRVETTGGTFECDQVVVATGQHVVPIVPSLAADLDPSIRQIDSLHYRNVGELADGDVLVVGAGNSGTDVALEAARAGHRVWLAGRHPGQVPINIDSPSGKRFTPVVMFVFRQVLTLRTPMGRAVREKMLGHGVNLVRNKLAHLDAAGINRVGRIESVRDGRPVTAGGDVLSPSTVVWCTGSRPNFSFLDVPFARPDGEVAHRRGVSTVSDGLYFMGLEFQFAAASGTIQGLDRDAQFLVRQLIRRARSVGTRAAELVA
jgi:putative flavoprotein involved in K+ transport